MLTGRAPVPGERDGRHDGGRRLRPAGRHRRRLRAPRALAARGRVLGRRRPHVAALPTPVQGPRKVRWAEEGGRGEEKGGKSELHPI